jgi:hypothetical protein
VMPFLCYSGEWFLENKSPGAPHACRGFFLLAAIETARQQPARGALG